MTPLEKARHLGTLNKPDRSRQYPLDTHAQIVDAVNLALTKIRTVEKTKDEEIAALKANLSLRNALVLMVITAALARAPEIWSWIMRITQ